MVLSFAGKQYEEKIPDQVTTSERNDLEAMIQKRADAGILIEDVRAMDEDLAHLDITTEDPSFRDHPRRDEAVARMLRVAGTRLVWIDRIHYIIDDVVKRWYRMNDKAREEATEYWGISTLSDRPSRECWTEGLKYPVPPRRGKPSVRVKEESWRS